MQHAAVRALCIVWALLASAAPIVALKAALGDDRFLPGHSHYGEPFDRGPRQSAYLMGGTGKIHFPVTTKNPLSQKFMEQGVGQLHGFWFVEAERSFREALRLDPDCAMAYWGLALSSHLHPTRAEQFTQLAGKHKAGLSRREQLYIDGLTAETGYLQLIKEFPKDIEAKAFEAWRLWHIAEEIDPPPRAMLGVAMSLAREVLHVDPTHPMHHAVIHIADFTETWGGAVDSADKCGDSAPSIGHLWHMPTHIYFAMRRFPEAAWQLEASIRTEHARMMHDRVLPDQVHLYAHNNEWLVRTLLILGRVHDARSVATHMIDLPRHPLLNVIEPPDHGQHQEESEDSHKEEKPVEMHGTSAYYGRDRMLQVLRQYEYYDDLIEACQSHYIEPTALPGEQGKVHLNLGVAHYCRGEAAEAGRQLEEVKKLLAQQLAARTAAFMQIANVPEQQRQRAASDVTRKYNPSLAQLQNSLDELESYREIATGFFVSRIMLMVYLAAIVVGEALVFWLLRRRMLMAILTIVVALGVGVWIFERHLALLYLPYDSTNVDFAYMSRKQLEAGDPDIAEWCAHEFAKERENQVRPQANLVEILYRVGKKDESRTEFDKLRSLAGTADLDAPPLARLVPMAHEFGYPTDWRLPEEIQKATAGRRPLRSLGPLRWRPWTAPNWTLSDADGKTHSLTDYRGKPVLLVFFLGNGCLHCKEQLHAFARRAQDFKDSGLTVIAISTDDQAKVKKSLTTWGTEPFPFLMVADPDKQAFQSFRAYDNFEDLALHGTFLIDGAGLCRWHDVSAEPFMDAEFVLGESKRLLAREVAPIEPDARVIAETPFPAQPAGKFPSRLLGRK